MKKKILFLILGISFGYSRLLVNIGIDGGAYYMQNKLGSLNTITADLAYEARLASIFSLFGYYQIYYSGTGFGSSVEPVFSERYQDHFMTVKGEFRIKDKIFLRPFISGLLEYYRYGKNEAWGKGLYDFFSLGAGLEHEYRIGDLLTLSAGARYQEFRYPNYTDLFLLYISRLDESPSENFRSLSCDAGIKEIKAKKIFFASAKYQYSLRYYVTKKVIRSDGYHYAEHEQSSVHHLEMLPGIRLRAMLFRLELFGDLLDSNQNLLSGTSLLNTAFYSDYFDYTLYGMRPQLAFYIKKHTLGINCGYAYKKYQARPAQQSDGSYFPSRLYIRLLSAGIEMNIAAGKYLSVIPDYIFAWSSSNSKYLAAGGLAYQAHVLSIKLLFHY
ncbi:MAG TPA: hypothetical protein DC049_11415 [Spirochaetia bacterium]|nr:hypothetical protein [Spirochaetia bacterium]